MVSLMFTRQHTFIHVEGANELIFVLAVIICVILKQEMKEPCLSGFLRDEATPHSFRSLPLGILPDQRP